jgi:hypothetical protein
MRVQPRALAPKRKDKTGIATKRRKRRKKRVDEKTSALGYGTGIAAKTCRAIGLAKAEEHKDRKKKSEVRIC